MASNDGQRLTVFGLGFRQHDSRKMHRILDHYERLPDNANDRAALYANLAILARNLSPDDTESIETWLANGGDFPFARPVRPPQPMLTPRGHIPLPRPGRRRLDLQGHDPQQLREAGIIPWDEDDSDLDDEMDDEIDDVPHPQRRAVPPPHRAQPRGGMNRHHHHRGGGGQFQGNNEFGRGQLFGDHGDDDAVPGPVPQQAPRNPPRPRRGGFGQVLNGGPALDPFMGHGPLPPHLQQVPHNAPQLPRPLGPGFEHGPVPPHPRQIPGNVAPLVPIPGARHDMFPPPMPAGRHGRDFGQAQPILDPFMGHGPRMGFPQQRPHSAFDITGPGRRLGEEGEETAPEHALPSSEEVERYKEIFNEEQEHADDEDEEMDVDMDDIYGEPAHQPQFPHSFAISKQSAYSPHADPTPEPTIECEVCYEDLPISEFPPNKITAVCQHEGKVCYGCLEQDIAIQIGEGVLGQLKCPSCPEKLSYEDIQAYASPDVFRR